MKIIIKYFIALFSLSLYLTFILTGCDEDNIIDDINRPLAPILSSPKNDTTDVPVPPILFWQASANATSYGVQVSTDSLFANNKVYDTSGLTLTSIQVDSLKNATIYYWRVNASNDDDASDWQKCWRFTTGRNCPGLPIVEYAGKTYNTVQIGKQCWLKENLDVGRRINGNLRQSDNYTIEKYCYNNDDANCLIYGGLYLWDEAMQYTTVGDARGICPEGWHIPTHEEFRECSTYVGGYSHKIKALGQGSGAGAGTNSSGFSALLSGYIELPGFSDYHFDSLGVETYFWGSTEWYTYSYSLWVGNDEIFIYIWPVYREQGFSVRCIRDQ